MNFKNAIELINNMVEQHRVEIGQRPEVTPVTWKGISMTIEEAKLAIQELESAKVQSQKAMNDMQTGGEITKLAIGGAGLAVIVTGTALMLFPPTSMAGAITLASGVGAAGISKVMGDGITDVGTNIGIQDTQQIDAYINSIKNAIIASV